MTSRKKARHALMMNTAPREPLVPIQRISVAQDINSSAQVWAMAQCNNYDMGLINLCHALSVNQSVFETIIEAS